MRTDILAGIRVLDFGRFIAGPFCAALLGDLGADVIRIERLEGGEDRFGAPIGPRGTGALYVAMNRNKRGITLNPAKPAGRDIVKRLVGTADVVVANLTPDVLANLGLDYASLSAIKPDIILTTVTAFGPNGPYSDRVGFDGVAQAMSGNMFLTGDGETPMKAYVPYVDFMTASLTAFGTVSALLERMRSGRGQVVEGALLLTALTAASSALVEEGVLGIGRTATGNRGQTSAPSDCFRTSDGWILVQTNGDAMFDRWAKMVGAEDLLTDPRCRDDEARGNHRDLICERMGRWCADKTIAQAKKLLDENRIPWGEVLGPRQSLKNEHIQAAQMLHVHEYPGVAKPVAIPRPPVMLSETPTLVRRRAPTLGEHTQEILSSLGYGPMEIEAFRRDRVV